MIWVRDLSPHIFVIYTFLTTNVVFIHIILAFIVCTPTIFILNIMIV